METVPRTSIQLLNEFEVARMLGVSVSTMRRWRLRKVGPAYLKIGALVKYRPEAIQLFIDSRPTGGGQ